MLTSKIMSKEETELVHKTSLAVLEKIGVKVNHDKVLDILADFGASVDKNEKIARLPENLVLESIEKAGNKHIIYGRDKQKTAEFGYGKQIFLSSGGQYLWIEEMEGERRPGTLRDARAAITLADALEQIDIVGAFILPAEIPSAVRDVHLYAELVKNATKPCFTWINTGKTARYILEIFKAVAGGGERLRAEPMVEAFVEPVSPLQFGREGLEVLIEFARMGLPVGFGPMAMSMGTAPATLAGTIAQENAEILTGITISQLLAPGLPVTYWGIPHIMDPATGNISFGSPEQGLMAIAMTRMANWYGLPAGVNVGLTDSNLPDAQNGIERGMSLLLGALAGADIFGHMGIVGADQGASLAELVINNEMASYLRRIFKAFKINEKTLALDVIERVGIKGHFLEDEHTLTHFRKEFWFPDIFERDNWDVWKEKGSKSVLQRANKKKAEILTHHKVDSLDGKINKQIQEIVEEADKDICGTKV